MPPSALIEATASFTETTLASPNDEPGPVTAESTGMTIGAGVWLAPGTVERPAYPSAASAASAPKRKR